MPAGRPTNYTPELAERMCATIAGGMSVTKMCALDWAPPKQIFYLWLMKHPEFYDQYIQAKESQSHCLVDEIVDIADTDENPKKAKVRVDARVIYAEKCAPRKYGKRQFNENTHKIDQLDNLLDELEGDGRWKPGK